MKKIIKTALFLTAFVSVGFTLNSCQDAINIDQPGQIDETILFTSVSNMNDFLVGAVYGSMDINNEIYLTAVLTDEVKPGVGSGGQEFQLHRYFLDPSETLTGNIWTNHYLVINRVNRLLEGATRVTPTNDTEQERYNNIIAQARAIRAFSYLQLETYFSTDMKNPNALGAILLHGIPLTDIQQPRSTNQEVYDFMNADLDYARSILKYNNSSGSRFYADRGFVNAVSARFNLYRGNIALAQQYAQDVVSNIGLTLTVANPIVTQTAPVINASSPSTQWSLEFYRVASSFNPYRNLWNDSARGEIIFALNRLPTGSGSNIGSRWNTNQSSIQGVPMWFLGRNLFNLINVPGDVRRYAYIDPSSNIDPNYETSSSPINSDQLVIDKYPGKTSAATRNDLKIFRISEMYFILAECAVATNNLSRAQTLIQEVREARNYEGSATTPVYGSTQAAYADILKERRVELALEGHRYIDLKRLATSAGVSMNRNPTDDIVAVTNLSNGDYRYTLPIPLREMIPNPKAIQNPGY